MANVVRDFEPRLTSILLRPFDDGRFMVFVDRQRVFDKESTGRFPNYEQEIKPRLAAGG